MYTKAPGKLISAVFFINLASGTCCSMSLPVSVTFGGNDGCRF